MYIFNRVNFYVLMKIKGKKKYLLRTCRYELTHVFTHLLIHSLTHAFCQARTHTSGRMT